MKTMYVTECKYEYNKKIQIIILNLHYTTYLIYNLKLQCTYNYNVWNHMIRDDPGNKKPEKRYAKSVFSAWFLGATHQMVAGWWLNRPIWKILVKMGIFPRGENKRQLKPPPNGGKSFLDTLSPIGCANPKSWATATRTTTRIIPTGNKKQKQIRVSNCGP